MCPVHISETFFTNFFIHHLRTVLKNFIPRSYQVRSPGQVKGPYVQKYLRLRSGYSSTTFRSTLNFQELIGAPAPVECISRNLDFSDLRSVRPSDLTIIGQWENVQMLFIPKIRDGVC